MNRQSLMPSTHTEGLRKGIKMNKRKRLAIAAPISLIRPAKMFLFVLSLVIFFGSGEAVAASVLSSSDLAKKVDEYIRTYVKEGNFSGAVIMLRSIR